MELSDILTLTIEGLREKLGELGLSTDGSKSGLQERLIRHFQTPSTADDDNSEYGEAASGGQRAEVYHHGPSTFTLRDIEETLSKFSGEGQPEVNQWLRDFEDCAHTVRWNELQKYIYARQLLTGAAKMFVRSQTSVRDWPSLKTSLCNEFGVQLSSIEVHRLLKGRRKKSTESFREYLYALMEIGAPISLDQESTIEYFIEGIPDSKVNKSILYQAIDINDLKAKIKVYEKINGSVHQSASKGFRPKQEQTNILNQPQGEKRCFKCGDKGHLANKCKTDGVICYKCKELGHKSFECKKNVKDGNVKVMKKEENNVQTLSSLSSHRIFKSIIVHDREIMAIIDTGSDISCLRKELWKMMGDVKLSSETKTLTGIGQKDITTLGCFSTNVNLDGIFVTITFHVVEDQDILYPAVIGNDVLEYVNMTITSDNVKFCSTISNTESKVEGGYNNLTLQDVFRELANINTIGQIGDLKVYDQIELGHLHNEERVQILKMLENYKPEKPDIFPVKMKILLSDEVPVWHSPRRMSFVDQQTVDQQVKEWLKEGIIRPSYSQYSSPVVLVSKKDGSKRLCCDYRRLNEKIIRDNFPMVMIDDILQRLQECKVFTTLDLRNGFFHVPVEEDSRKYTAFVTHNGQYEFLYVPFGISNSPAVFCRYISAIFHDLIRDGTLVVYMDDMIIPSKDRAEGLLKLRKVLQVAASNGLDIKWSKCQFLMEKITFLGYIIENSTILPSEEKTAAVENFPLLRDRKSIQRFLGLTSYFRRFIPNYAIVAKPLSDLLRKNVQFKMGDEQIVAFQQLKSSLVSAPVLKLYNPKAATEIHTDASMYGYGGVLLQKNSEDQQWHPIEFMSRKTTPAEEKYHSYELEVLAIIEALKKWRIYVMGIRIKIVTDCNAFTMTMRKQDVPLRVSRWALFLQQFDYVIEHRSGSKMRHVDALSRVSCLLMEDSLRHRIKEAQLQDEWNKAVREILQNSCYEDYYLKYDILHKDSGKELIVIPANMEKEIIEMAHRQGHFAARKTQDLVERTFYIPNLSKKCENIVKSCIECIMANTKAGRQEGFLNPIDKTDKPLMTYHLDHVGPMETTHKQYNHILVVVDAFSKFVWLYPTKSTGTQEVVDRLRKQSVIFGNPFRMITDRGTAFTSNMFKEYCEEEGIQHLLIATGVPRGNGQVERIHKIIVPMLTKLCIERPQNWYRYVDRVQQVINNTTSRSTGNTPFRILTGLNMRIKENPDIRAALEEIAVYELEQERDILREEARENIQRIQQENKRNYDKNRVLERQYNVNDLVAIKRTQFGTGLKLKPKFLGPYKVIKKLNHGRYEVEKVGEFEGSSRCTSVAEYMKPWGSTFGSNVRSGGPNVGNEGKGRRRSRRLTS